MAPVRETTATTPPASEEANVPRLIPQNIALGEYIFLRIAQANPKLKTIFEIPGDFNLNFLEYGYSPLVTHEGIKLINTCNELNGAYAADGYSKAIDGLSVFVSTYGVGELSAINGIANAYTEYGAVLHIVGTPSLRQREEAKVKLLIFIIWYLTTIHLALLTMTFTRRWLMVCHAFKSHWVIICLKM